VLGLTEVLDVVPGLGPGDDGGDGDGDAVEQFVEAGAVDAGVGQLGEVVGKGQVVVGGPGSPPGESGAGRSPEERPVDHLPSTHKLSLMVRPPWGSWAFDIATKIGVDIASAAMKSALGNS
jgi:hypothetical protein